MVLKFYFKNCYKIIRISKLSMMDESPEAPYRKTHNETVEAMDSEVSED